MKERILQHFKGITTDLDKKIAVLRRFGMEKGNYSSDYIDSYLNDWKAEVNEIIAERRTAAKGEIEAIKAELKTKVFKDPYADIKGPIITTEDKILVQLERMNKMQIFRAEMDSVDNPNELKEIYEQYQDDADFNNLFDLEIKKRVKSDKGIEYKQLHAELNDDPKEFKELDQMSHLLDFFFSDGKYHTTIEETGFDKYNFTTIDDIAKQNL
ncbi:MULTISPECIES: hypothetical protein [Bacillus]|uniref:hypothetical protein n=1 Tax=Bacillus TaxID=1386 RepID=UPI00030996E9|nr:MULTISPECIES: hypothetical protein [Bacillus]